jgi:hypothetical protein
MKLLVCNFRHHLFTVSIYDLNESRLFTFQALLFIYMFLLEKHAIILANINFLIIHTETRKQFL